MSIVIGRNYCRKRRVVEDRRACIVSTMDDLTMMDTHIGVARELLEGLFFLWRLIPSPMASAATTTRTSAKATKLHFARSREGLSPTIRSCDLVTLSPTSVLTASGGKVL